MLSLRKKKSFLFTIKSLEIIDEAIKDTLIGIFESFEIHFILVEDITVSRNGIKGNETVTVPGKNSVHISFNARFKTNSPIPSKIMFPDSCK